jgi:hypothetical protein
MGLEQGGGQRNYLSISDGKIAQRVQEDAEGAIKKTNKEGTKTYYEKHYPAISGFIRNVQKRSTEYGEKLQIEIEDAGETFLLEMPWSSRYSSGFFTCIPNIDVTKKIRFSPYMKVAVENGKEIKKTMLYLAYNDEKGTDGKSVNIPWAFTKENPNGLPEMKKVLFKGKEEWDDTDRQAFFEKIMNEILVPKILAAKAGVTLSTEKPKPFINTPAPTSEPITTNGDADSDDVPF